MQKYGENYIILTHTNNILLEVICFIYLFSFFCLWSNTEVNLKVQNGAIGAVQKDEKKYSIKCDLQLIYTDVAYLSKCI